MFGRLEWRLNLSCLLGHLWPKTFSSVVCLGQVTPREPTREDIQQVGAFEKGHLGFHEGSDNTRTCFGVGGVSRTGDR